MPNDNVTFTKEFISSLADLLDESYDNMCFDDCNDCDNHECTACSTRTKLYYAKEILRLAL